MSAPEQLSLLQDDLAPNQWTCPTCQGSRRALRLLYPDERSEGGPLVAEGPCRTCYASGVIDYDPLALDEIPFG